VKKLKTKPKAQIHLLQPYSMEELNKYLHRFDMDREMMNLIPDSNHRFITAKTIFEQRWKEAQVTVTRLDGARYFID
jgi:hypothetical protein